MANPQPTDSHLRLANSILDEIILRDFSKRQRSIIDFILRLSWSCNKKFAVIPKYTKNFELCGISNQNITKELDYLVLNKVIFWDKATNIFQINKNFEKWLIPYKKEANILEFKKLISLNLIHSQNESKTLELRESLLNFESKALKKQELNEAEKPNSEQEKNTPITSLITSNYIKGKTKVFKKPLIHEIEAYCLERDNDINAEQFFDFYEARGWLIGKNKIKCWKACVRTWEKNGKSKEKSSSLF